MNNSEGNDDPDFNRELWTISSADGHENDDDTVDPPGAEASADISVVPDCQSVLPVPSTEFVPEVAESIIAGADPLPTATGIMVSDEEDSDSTVEGPDPLMFAGKKAPPCVVGDKTAGTMGSSGVPKNSKDDNRGFTPMFNGTDLEAITMISGGDDVSMLGTVESVSGGDPPGLMAKETLRHNKKKGAIVLANDIVSDEVRRKHRNRILVVAIITIAIVLAVTVGVGLTLGQGTNKSNSSNGGASNGASNGDGGSDGGDFLPTRTKFPQPTPPPTSAPSESPTNAPTTREPSATPTNSPAPSGTPTQLPSSTPSIIPTRLPSASPSLRPSGEPSIPPTYSLSPSGAPSVVPTLSAVPSLAPSLRPSTAPSKSLAPSLTVAPSQVPSVTPSVSLAPSVSPSESPSAFPTTEKQNMNMRQRQLRRHERGGPPRRLLQ